MSSPLKNIVLAGATGSIGRPILAALQSANTFNITLLTRASSTASPASSGDLPTRQADYSSVDALVPLLADADALVIAIAAHEPTPHTNLITAAVRAGVKLIVPSEFGSDLANPRVQDFAPFVPKIQVGKFLEDATRGTGTAWTAVRNGPFLDFCWDIGLFLDVKGKKVTVYDGGDQAFSATFERQVGQAVVGVLRHWEEVKNRAVYVEGARVTQNQLIGYAKEATGPEGWTVEEAKTEDVEAQARKTLKETPGNVLAWVLGFLIRAVFGKGHGGDFEKPDNELLGVKRVTDDEVREWVKQKVAGSQ